MTETIENTNCENNPVHWVAFLVALIAAPVFPAFVAFGVLSVLQALGDEGSAIVVLAAIVIMAPAFGGPVYLLVGGPFLWHAARSDKGFAGWAFFANLASAPIVALIVFLVDERLHDPVGTTLFLVGFGMIFAPFWGAIFGMIYSRLCNIRWLP